MTRDQIIAELTWWILPRAREVECVYRVFTDDQVGRGVNLSNYPESDIASELLWLQNAVITRVQDLQQRGQLKGVA